MAAVCAVSVEPLPVVLAEPAVVAGTISVELMGFAVASVGLVVEELAVAVASAAGLVDVESGVLVRLAVLVEPEVGSGERVEAPVPSVVVGLAAPAEAGTELLEFAVEPVSFGEVTASPPEPLVLVDPVETVLVIPFVVAVELSAVVEPAAGLELTALAVSVELAALVELEEDVTGLFEVAAATLGVVVLAEAAVGMVAETVELDAVGSDVPVEFVTVELVALVEPEATVEFAIVLAAPAVELVVPVASVAAAFPVPVELVTEPVGFVVPAVGLVVLAVPTPVVLAVPAVSAEPDAAAVAPYMPGSLPSGAETVSWATVGLEPSFEYARM
ncbi:hypothetical protein FOHLNKBM_6154 [Methylobacterium longum]|nr:hypothetical protein FOHLNKBM_6154 [Methylobacterium longum]